MTGIIDSHIDSRSRADAHPLSIGQRGLWLAYQLHPQRRGHNNLSVAMRLRPALAEERLRSALTLLATRHPMLRVRFGEVAGEPCQWIDPQAQVPLYVRRVTALDDAHVLAELHAEKTRPIDVTHEPPIRARLYTTYHDESLLCLVFDHLAIDGWSFFQLMDELADLLRSGAVPEHVEPPTADSTYRAYVDHERAWLRSPRAQKQLAYWRALQPSLTPELDLRADPEASDAPEGRGAVSHLLPADLSLALHQFAAAQGSTLFSALLASYSLLLHRLTQQEHLTIGSIMPTRGERWRQTLGNFVNPVAMPFQLDPHMTVLQLLKRTDGQIFRTLKNKDYPFAAWTHELRSEREAQADQHPRHSASVKTSYVFQKARHGQDMTRIIACCPTDTPIAWAGFDVESIGDYVPSGGVGEDLTLGTLDLGERIYSYWSYDTRKLTRATVERFARCWHVILRGMVEDPTRKLSELPWLSEHEQARVVNEWNTRAELPGAAPSLQQRFEAHAQRDPQHAAVCFQGRTLSYQQLNEHANQLAHYLRDVGVTPDSRVAICMDRGPELVIALLATLKAGGAYLPMDPAYPVERLAYMLQDSAPVLALTHGAARRVMTAIAGDRQVPVIDLEIDAACWSSAARNDPEPTVSARSLAYVIYTSGSTGRPKGVLNEHAGLANMILAQTELFGVTPESRVLQFASTSFDASVWEIGMALGHGASLHLAERNDLMPGRPLLDTMNTHNITHVTLPPSALAACEEHALPFAAKVVIVAGEALSPSLARRWSQRVALFNAYGPTETTVCATAIRIKPDDLAISIGHPIANARIYVLDPQQRPVPVGVAGEIYIGGAPVGRGYLNRPELTHERFIKDPFSNRPEGRMYRTGDLGRWLADGRIEYLGRNDFQVKLRGFRIELGEIEARIAACSGIAEAAVLARDHAPGDRQLVAYYRARPGLAPSADMLRAELNASLPEHMVPAAYVQLDQFPFTPNGKIDRKALPAPDQHAYARHAYEAPRGELERALAQLWRELLQQERVGRRDDFFALGGHSLKAIQLVARVARELGIEVPLRALFSRPTLAGFAVAVTQARVAGAHTSNLVLLRQDGELKPLFGVHPLGGTVEYLRLLANKLNPGVPVYGLEASGWGADETPSSSMAEIAARYVEQIRAVQPKGPYRLLGYSAGGLIAYAMAEALLERGESVEFLGVIDAPADLGVTREVIEAVDRIEHAEREDDEAAADIVFVRDSVAGLIPDRALTALHDAAHAGDLATMLQVLNEHAPALIPGKLGADLSHARRGLRVMRATKRALCRYYPAPLPLPVTLFVASDADSASRLTASWQRVLTTPRLHTVPVAGSHFSMMDPPHIDSLARALDVALQRPRRITLTSAQDALSIQ